LGIQQEDYKRFFAPDGSAAGTGTGGF
jgi:hypothetical protein